MTQTDGPTRVCIDENDNDDDNRGGRANDRATHETLARRSAHAYIL